ncbi:hypothetical protein CE91St41_32360 [Oscillospiraceae bacterium]|nr:hypothetical protein CE91St40_32360 [Oscillospiraceae bacterium]BDF76347.1 hypothetical protein CE91St41_32360 [Oscillospiraceae bacterium]
MEWNQASPTGTANSRNVIVAQPPEEEGLLSLCGESPCAAPTQAIPHGISRPAPAVPFEPAAPAGQTAADSETATVRLLHAAADEGAVQVLIGPRPAASGLSFGNATGGFRLPCGPHTITLRPAGRGAGPVLRETVDLAAGVAATLAIVRAGGGLALVRVDDLPPGRAPRDCGCLRAVNLVRGAPALDVVLSGGPCIFSGVGCAQATPWRRARPKTYECCAAQAGPDGPRPLASFCVDARAGAAATIYLLGDWTGGRSIQARVVADG